jgi:hypothetical protein
LHARPFWQRKWQVLEKALGLAPLGARPRRPAASVSGCPHGSHELRPNSVPGTVPATGLIRLCVPDASCRRPRRSGFWDWRPRVLSCSQVGRDIERQWTVDGTATVLVPVVLCLLPAVCCPPACPPVCLFACNATEGQW